MSTGEQRKSVRISEMDERRAQRLRRQNKDKRTCEAEIEDLGNEEVNANPKRGRKKTKVRSVQNLVVETVGDKVQKVGNSGGEDRPPNSANISPATVLLLPNISRLELLLDILKRRDWDNIFAEPVDPDEVEDYYETIKKPMDFGTISRKLNGGSYKTLAEFEHDVFLVWSNAMFFNASSTIYYRQARAIRDLSQKLFDTLKTDPENFERECSVLRRRAGRRTNNGSYDQSNDGLASKGSRQVKRKQHSEEDRIGTSKPWEKFLKEKKPIISSVQKSLEPINPILETRVDKVGYEGSLMQYVQDMGSKLQMFAQEKVQKWKDDEAFKHQIVASQLEPQILSEIPNVASGHNGIRSALSLDSRLNNTRSQNFGGTMDTLGDQLKAQKASILDTPNINDTLNRGFVQANTSVYGGKVAHGMGDGAVSFNQSMAAQGIGTPCLSTLWNNPGRNSTNLISNSINKGKNVLTENMGSSFSKENPHNFDRNLVPPMREGDNSLKENLSYDDSGNVTPPLSTTRDTSGNWDKVISSYIDMGKNIQMAEATSSYPVQNPSDLQSNSFQSMKPEGNAFNQNLSDQGIGSSYLYPALLGAGDSYFPGAENMLYNSVNFFANAINMGVNVPMMAANPMSLLESPGDNLGKSVQTMTDGVAAFKDLVPNQGTRSAYISTPCLSYFPVKSNMASNPDIFIPTGINNDTINVQMPGMTSSGPSMVETLLARDHGIASSATFQSLLTTATAGLDINSLTAGLDINSLTEGVHQIQAVGTGGGSNYEGNSVQPGQALSWLQPTQWAPLPIYNFLMQEQPKTAEAGLAGQAASSEWQVLGANAPNGQVAADAPMMNSTHSIDHRQEELNTRAPLYNNQKQTGL